MPLYTKCTLIGVVVRSHRTISHPKNNPWPTYGNALPHYDKEALWTSLNFLRAVGLLIKKYPTNAQLHPGITTSDEEAKTITFSLF